MPDGKRRRRHNGTTAKQFWYAFYRSYRYRRRYGEMENVTIETYRVLVVEKLNCT